MHDKLYMATGMADLAKAMMAWINTTKQMKDIQHRFLHLRKLVVDNIAKIREIDTKENSDNVVCASLTH